MNVDVQTERISSASQIIMRVSTYELKDSLPVIRPGAIAFSLHFAHCFQIKRHNLVRSISQE